MMLTKLRMPSSPDSLFLFSTITFITPALRTVVVALPEHDTVVGQLVTADSLEFANQLLHR